jgi:multisubunit Na+/H+ antiporter MnhG subunit
VLLVGAGSIYESWTMFPVLTHSLALTELPTSFARLAVATTLGVGAALLAITIYGGNR